MNFIIVLMMIEIFLLNFKFIDKIFSIAYQTENNESCTNLIKTENALLFGNKLVNKELADLFKDKNINCIFLCDINDLDKTKSYSYIIAASESDLDNLMICTICSKTIEIKKTIALCNYSYNKKIYEDNHISYLCGNNISIIFLALSLFAQQ